MNRGQMRGALVSRLGIPPTGDGLLTPEALNDCINLALTDLSDARQWPWLLTSASVSFTDGVAAFPTDPPVVHLRELTVNGRRAKKASSLAEFLDCLAAGAQRVWFYEGTNIKLAPVPSTAPSAAVLYYLQPEPALDQDGLSPQAPSQFHNVIVARASYHANVRKKQWESAAQDNGEYERGLKNMGDNTRMTTGPRAVRAVGSTSWAVW